MTNDGIAIKLNLLPNLIINNNLSLAIGTSILRAGARTIPKKIDPPTQIEEHVIWIHVTIASAIGIAT
jgi:hypothetical protein